MYRITNAAIAKRQYVHVIAHKRRVHVHRSTEFYTSESSVCIMMFVAFSQFFHKRDNTNTHTHLNLHSINTSALN